MIRPMLTHAEPEVVARAIEALERGPAWGLLVAPPSQLGAETIEEAAAIAAAGERGVFVGLAPIHRLIAMLPGETTRHGAEQIADMVRQLAAPPPAGQCHVMALFGDCAATVSVRADPQILERLEDERAALARVEELKRAAAPEIQRRAPEALSRPGRVFLVTTADRPAVARVGGDAAAAAERGFYVGLHDAAVVTAALPLEELDAEGAVRAARRLAETPPPGEVRVALAHADHLFLFTVRPLGPTSSSERS
jgi:hypothetical protein